MRSKRPSAGGATNLPRARCIGTKSWTRDGMVGEGSSREGTTSERKPLKTLQSYRPSSYRAIQRLYSGKNLNSRKKRETGRQKKKLPRKSSRLSGYRNIIPALTSLSRREAVLSLWCGRSCQQGSLISI
jgi:hypothetical protein